MIVFKQTYHLINVHPGQQFNFTMKALDQGGYPVPANIFVNNLLSNKHRLHPLSQIVNSSCTSVYYRLYSSEEDTSVMFRLIIENPCRNFDDSQDYYQIFSIFIERCPVGFAISEGDDKCTCNRNVRNLTQNCFIDDSSFERIKNSFWISLTNNNELAVYDSRCPLDYCRDSSVNVIPLFSVISTGLEFCVDSVGKISALLLVAYIAFHVKISMLHWFCFSSWLV